MDISEQTPVHGAESTPWDRASSGIRCLPFRLAFYRLVGERAISSSELCNRADSPPRCFSPMGPDRIEGHFIWLICLGVPQREVDGQGHTERVRLTPMGRRWLLQWSEELPRVSLLEKTQHFCRRLRPRL
jgi:hypothetical protein